MSVDLLVGLESAGQTDHDVPPGPPLGWDDPGEGGTFAQHATRWAMRLTSDTRGGSGPWNPQRLLNVYLDAQAFTYEIGDPGHDDWLGCFDFLDNHMTIRRGLHARQHRSVLAHELVHVIRGPVPRHEESADREEAFVGQVAARALISHEALWEALRWTSLEKELAGELWVDLATLWSRLDGLTEAEQGNMPGGSLDDVCRAQVDLSSAEATLTAFAERASS